MPDAADPWYLPHFSQRAAEAVYIFRATREPLIALRALAVITEEADKVTRAAVEESRESGHTWAEIADALGVTRQAVQRRYGSARDPDPGDT